MNPYKILGVSEDSSEEEIKKAYRKLSAKYHPDTNQDKDAEQKFKDIQSAYQQIINPEPTGGYDVNNIINSFFGGNPFGRNPGFTAFVNPFVNRQEHLPPVEIDLHLSFEEYVLGCQKEINYKRRITCRICQGMGKEITKDKCKICQGTGQISQQLGKTRQTISFVASPCQTCFATGRFVKDNCQECKGEKFNTEEISGKIKISPVPNNRIMLAGRGNITSSGQDPLIINITHSNDKELEITDDKLSISSTLTISLLEALQGTVKTVRTIHGDKQQHIPEMSKNGDILERHGDGIRQSNISGSHFITLNVKYPSSKSINKIIEILKSELN